MDAPEKIYITETQDSDESTAKRENWTSVVSSHSYIVNVIYNSII